MVEKAGILEDLTNWHCSYCMSHKYVKQLFSHCSLFQKTLYCTCLLTIITICIFYLYFDSYPILIFIWYKWPYHVYIIMCRVRYCSSKELLSFVVALTIMYAMNSWFSVPCRFSKWLAETCSVCWHCTKFSSDGRKYSSKTSSISC